MVGLNMETRKLEGTKALSVDLARQILSHFNDGKIAIVTDKPLPLLSATRKQWQKIIRQAERKRSSVLNPRKFEIEGELAHLRRMTFTAKSPTDDPQGEVSFATTEQFLQAPPICQTLYITCGIERHELYMLTAWMPPHGLVVFYEDK